MLTSEHLLDLLKNTESDRVERTMSESKTDKFGEAICAFANDLPNSGKPGYLLIGAKDDGTLCGLKVTDELERNVGGIRSDGNLLPQVRMNLQKFSLESGDVLVVEVFPSESPPVRYKAKCWVRVGPRRATANEQEERALFEKRQSKAKAFDSRTCDEAGLSDLARPLFDTYRTQAVDPETIENNYRSYEEQLASLRFFDTSRKRPTNAGMILFGKNTRFFLPGAYVQYLVFPGTSLTDTPIDQAEVGGDLATVI
ncbi:MAG: RNA-binding domain-containing protein, partial [Vulcanimicrobiota bacterium]